MSHTTSAQQIMDRSGPGDIPAEYWDIVETYRGELVNQAMALIGRREDAEDVVQETFCEAFKNPERLKKAQSLGACLRMINKANALDRVRNTRRESAKTSRKEKAMPQRMLTTGGFSLMELGESLAKAIEGLPESHRTVVVLRFWESLSFDEISKRTGQPTSTVWRLFYEATQRLYESLKDKLDGAPAAFTPASEAALAPGERK